MENINKKKPVILLTGYLGSGKTTVMNELLKNTVEKKTAVIVNDMGAVNIDASLIKKGNMSSYNDSELVELQNGCICCTLRDEFMAQIESISKEQDIDSILVEASGISNPSSIADAFSMYEEMHPESSVYLSAIATVVDAERIYTEFLGGLQENIDNAEELKKIEEENEDDPDIINLVMDQIEFCNLVLLNKCDLMKEEELDEVKKVIMQLQPEAELIETSYGKIEAQVIFHNQVFDYDKVSQSSLMGKAMAGEHHHSSKDGAHEEFGISSFVYEVHEPFFNDKFMSFVENDYPESIIRAKGYIWFADDDIHVQLFEQAGRNSTITEMSNWTASFSKKEQQEVFDQYPEVLDDWDPVYGDRINQIVFIGKNYDKNEICKKLDECLDKSWEKK